jgi:hypothetical protein
MYFLTVEVHKYIIFIVISFVKSILLYNHAKGGAAECLGHTSLKRDKEKRNMVSEKE